RPRRDRGLPRSFPRRRALGAHSEEHRMRSFLDRTRLPGDRARAGTIAPNPPDPRGAALEVRGLSLAYGTSTVVRDVSLEAQPGQVICVMGRNGAGKTTLMNGI